jgi:hypothetical protein
LTNSVSTRRRPRSYPFESGVVEEGVGDEALEGELCEPRPALLSISRHM